MVICVYFASKAFVDKHVCLYFWNVEQIPFCLSSIGSVGGMTERVKLHAYECGHLKVIKWKYHTIGTIGASLSNSLQRTERKDEVAWK